MSENEKKPPPSPPPPRTDIQNNTVARIITNSKPSERANKAVVGNMPYSEPSNKK